MEIFQEMHRACPTVHRHVVLEEAYGACLY
jgi:hypothetical protein